MKKALVVCHMGRHYRKFGHYDIKPLQELGYEVHFAANFNLDIDKVEDDSIILHQVDFQRSPFSLKNIKAYKQIKQIIKENDYDLIHCQSPVGGVLTRLANKNLKHKSRIIYTAHGFHFYKGAPITMWLLFYPIEKYLAKYTDTIITINKEDYNLAKNKFSKRCLDIRYVTGVGVDRERLQIKLNNEEYIELRKSLNLKKKDYVLIYVAELLPRKNQLFLIDCVEKVINQNKDVHLLLVGNDSYFGKCQKKVKKLGLEKNIHILGQRNDVPKLLKISNLVVSSSKQEGLPVHVIEAFASGLPVVGMQCRGITDLIIDNENGYVVENNNDFIKKITYLIDNEKVGVKIAKKNLIKSQDYDIIVIEKIMKSIFK